MCEDIKNMLRVLIEKCKPLKTFQWENDRGLVKLCLIFRCGKHKLYFFERLWNKCGREIIEFLEEMVNVE